MKPDERKVLLRNLAFYSLGDSLWGFLSSMTVPSVVLVFLLYKAGASSSMIGSISAIETGGILLPQFFGVYLFRSIAKRKLQLAYWHWFVILPFMLLMSLLTFFYNSIPPTLYRWGMLMCFAGYSITLGMVIAVWVEHFIGYVFQPEVRGTVMGLAAFGFSLAGMGGAMFAGRLIERMPFPNSYGLLYLIGVAVGVVSFAFFLSVRDPQPYPPETQAERVKLMDIFHTASASLGSRNFRNFIIGRMLMAVGFCILPFIAIHYASPAGGALPAGVVVSSYAAMTFSSAIGNLILGRLGDIHGHRLGLIIGVAVQIATLLLLLFLPGWLGCILAYSGAGVISAVGVAPVYTLIIETCPHPKRVQHISIANFLIGVPAALAPVAAGWAAEHLDLRYLFAICLAISLLALGWILRFFKEPRQLARAETRGNEAIQPG